MEDSMKKENLYNRIDDEEDMTDSEKREAYYAEIANQEMDERQENNY